jgi:hypothetical protein
MYSLVNPCLALARSSPESNASDGIHFRTIGGCKKKLERPKGRLILGGLFGFLEKIFFLIFCNNFFSKKINV